MGAWSRGSRVAETLKMSEKRARLAYYCSGGRSGQGKSCSEQSTEQRPRHTLPGPAEAQAEGKDHLEWDKFLAIAHWDTPCHVTDVSLKRWHQRAAAFVSSPLAVTRSPRYLNPGRERARPGHQPYSACSFQHKQTFSPPPPLRNRPT